MQPSWAITFNSVPIASSANWNNLLAIYNVTNPFQWMDTMNMQKWSQYYKQCQAPHILSWWTVLKHATSSTYLFTYLCYPNLHSRSRTSYMVLIFLAATLTARRYRYVIQALENIKLLGAIYWLTYRVTETHPQGSSNQLVQVIIPRNHRTKHQPSWSIHDSHRIIIRALNTSWR
jgi:hypothetical protein